MTSLKTLTAPLNSYSSSKGGIEMDNYTNLQYIKPAGRLIVDGRYIVGNRKGLKKNYLVGKFYGVNTALDFIEKHDGKIANPSKCCLSSQANRGKDWVRFRTYKESLHAIRKTPEVFRDFKTTDIKVIDHDVAGNDIEYGVTGDYLDVGAFMSGEPEVFASQINGKANNRFVRIIVNGGLRSGTTEKQINERAKGVLTLVDSLESTNIRAEVVVIYHTNNCHLEIVVKQYQDVLNIDEVASSLSADFFRRIYFKWSEHSGSHTHTYGIEEPIIDELDKTTDAETVILIENGVRDWGTIEAVFKKLYETIETSDDIRSKLFYINNRGSINTREITK